MRSNDSHMHYVVRIISLYLIFILLVKIIIMYINRLIYDITLNYDI